MPSKDNRLLPIGGSLLGVKLGDHKSMIARAMESDEVDLTSERDDESFAKNFFGVFVDEAHAEHLGKSDEESVCEGSEFSEVHP